MEFRVFICNLGGKGVSGGQAGVVNVVGSVAPP